MVMRRKERTRHLIELGGLVQKAGLVDLTDDDRATLYGAMLELAGRARGEDAGDVLALWKRRGKRAFDAEAEGAACRAMVAGTGSSQSVCPPSPAMSLRPDSSNSVACLCRS